MAWKVSVSVLASALCALAASTVEDLARIAAERSRDLEAARHRVAEARGLLRQSGMRPPPSLEFESSTGRPLGSPGKEEYSAAYSHPVETGGKRDKRVRVAEKSVALAEAELALRTLRLKSEVKLRFLDATAEQKRLASLGSLIDSYNDSVKLTEARVAQGDAAPLEGQLLLVELNRIEAQRRAANGRLQAALVQLRRLCGLTATEPLTLAEETPPAQKATYAVNELRQRALARRADLLAARLVEEQGSAEVALSEAQGRPDVALTARYSHRNERFADVFGFTASGAMTPLRDRDNVLSFGVSIPLLTRRRNLGNVEAAAARAAGARSLRQHLEAAIPLEIDAAWQRWNSSAEVFEILNGGVVRQSEKNIEIIRQAYALGQLRLLDVLNEQRRLIDTRMAYIDAEADAGRAFIELELAAGGELR